VPLLMMLLGFTLFFVAILLVRLRGEVLSRERSASWIREVVSAGEGNAPERAVRA
jgi:heme exporter protein C